jgi:hypothetical protein
LHVLLVFGVLLGLNEVLRRSLRLSFAVFLLVPVALTFTVWINTGTGAYPSISTWFHWAKLYSVIAGVLWFTAMRQFDAFGGRKYAKWVAAGILAVNIFEAVARDIQLGVEGGPFFHYLNALAGILNVIAIADPADMRRSDAKSRDMLWPKLSMLWIIAYDVWNLVYIWNCVPEHACYGLAVLGAATVAVFWNKGSWLQARAYTLGLWMMYVMSVPGLVDDPAWSFRLPADATVQTVANVVSLLLNVVLVAVLIRDRLAGRKASLAANA